jgi:hypothetical protein
MSEKKSCEALEQSIYGLLSASIPSPLVNDDEPGKGSTFDLYFPLVEETESDHAVSGIAPLRGTGRRLP